jgi:hypothetical protein
MEDRYIHTHTCAHSHLYCLGSQRGDKLHIERGCERDKGRDKSVCKRGVIRILDVCKNALITCVPLIIASPSLAPCMHVRVCVSMCMSMCRVYIAQKEITNTMGWRPALAKISFASPCRPGMVILYKA